MFKNIPRSRIILYALIAGLLPFIFILANLWGKQQSHEELNDRMTIVENRALNYKRQQASNMAVIQHYKDADHFYIDKYIETLTFLEPEIESLQKIVNHKNFTGDSEITSRLDALTGPSNSIVFVEGVVQSYPLYQETTETLSHPIEVNVTDIQKILARIEGVEIGSYKPGPNPPQLLVLDFKIDKKKTIHESEIYLLNLKLLKREYL